jgi:hypothetical protein
VNIQSQAENDYVHNTIRTINYVYIGYTWTTQLWAQNPNNLNLLALTEGSSYTNFDSGEGNGDEPSSACTGLGFSSNGKWHDVRCDNDMLFWNLGF